MVCMIGFAFLLDLVVLASSQLREIGILIGVRRFPHSNIYIYIYIILAERPVPIPIFLVYEAAETGRGFRMASLRDTKPFAGPGTGPLTRRSPRSRSTLTICTLGVVTFFAPI
jgi:hypothetical protein